MTKDKDEARQAFLIGWYNILWNNARQSMDGIWKLLGPITLVGTIWFAMYEEYIPFNLGNSLVFVIIFWAINITIDFHQWFRRNLIFFTAVEREFLNDQDYGRLIPRKYREPDTEWVSFFKICLSVFCALLAMAVIVSLWPLKVQSKWQYFWYQRYEYLVLLLGIIYTIKNYFSQEASSDKYINELFNKK